MAAWRTALQSADGVLLSSPEYAHGIPGALKNALDWVVGSGEFYAKAVGLLNPSPDSLFAHPQLAEVLRTMGANVVEGASVTVPIPRRGATSDSVAADADSGPLLERAIAALLHAVNATAASDSLSV